MVFLKALIFYILCNSLEYCSLTFVSQFASAVPCSDGLYLEWFVGSLPFLPSCALQKRAPAHYHVSPILPPPRTQGDVSKANTKCPLPLASALLGSGRHDFFFFPLGSFIFFCLNACLTNLVKIRWLHFHKIKDTILLILLEKECNGNSK